jgi:hypothetical protein
VYCVPVRGSVVVLLMEVLEGCEVNWLEREEGPPPTLVTSCPENWIWDCSGRLDKTFNEEWNWGGSEGWLVNGTECIGTDEINWGLDCDEV